MTFEFPFSDEQFAIWGKKELKIQSYSLILNASPKNHERKYYKNFTLRFPFKQSSIKQIFDMCYSQVGGANKNMREREIDGITQYNARRTVPEEKT